MTNDIRRILVVGASLAGARAAQNLRVEGFEGELTLIGSESHLPYDRPPLSKGILSGETDAENLTLNPASTYADASIELLLGEPASKLNTAKQILTVGGEQLSYDALIIATGATPRKLSGIPQISGVEVLRTIDDALAIKARLKKDARVVVIGAGFIGSEVASSAARQGCHTTVVEAARTPLTRGLGAQMGKICGDLHSANQVTLLTGTTVQRVIGIEQVEAVLLSNGLTLPADLVVVGIGVEPCTGWLTNSGLEISDGIVCNPYLNAGAPGVYAIGDVAKVPNQWIGPEPKRFEHWTAATEQAMLVAKNLLSPEAAKPYNSVPFVWSDQYGSRIQIAGNPEGTDQAQVLVGSTASNSFVAGYRNSESLTGVMALNSIKPFVQYRRLLMNHGSWADAIELAKSMNE